MGQTQDYANGYNHGNNHHKLGWNPGNSGDISQWTKNSLFDPGWLNGIFQNWTSTGWWYHIIFSSHQCTPERSSWIPNFFRKGFIPKWDDIYIYISILFHSYATLTGNIVFLFLQNVWFSPHFRWRPCRSSSSQRRRRSSVFQPPAWDAWDTLCDSLYDNRRDNIPICIEYVLCVNVYMYSICTVYVQYMYSICTVYVQYM